VLACYSSDWSSITFDKVTGFSWLGHDCSALSMPLVRWALHAGVPSIPSPYEFPSEQLRSGSSNLQENPKIYSDFLEDVCAPKRKREVVYLYSIGRKISLFASPEIAARAKDVVEAIIAAYYAPSRNFTCAEEIISHSELDPLRAFSESCRAELGV
jgi:hypothetical protein